MKLPWFNIIVLSVSAGWAILWPESIQHYAEYSGPDVLIVDWGIYAMAVTLMMIAAAASNDPVIMRRWIGMALILCYLVSFVWNIKMYMDGNISASTTFVYAATILNSLAVVEITLLWVVSR